MEAGRYILTVCENPPNERRKHIAIGFATTTIAIRMNRVLLSQVLDPFKTTQAALEADYKEVVNQFLLDALRKLLVTVVRGYKQEGLWSRGVTIEADVAKPAPNGSDPIEDIKITAS